jgi:uncharacterized protein YbjT (DUF2867 family)
MNLVIGSTGLLGGLIVGKLVARGKPIRVMVRQSSRVAGVETVVGDLKEPASLERACHNVTTVITTANSAQRSGSDTVESVDLEGNRALIRAATNAGVRHFVFVSAAFVDVHHPNAFLAAKARTEEFLRASGLAWTIIAPHVFLDVWFNLLVASALAAGLPVSLVNGGQKRHSFIAVDDVAEFTARAVDMPAAIGRHLVLGGPEALSWTDIIAKTTEILGAPVPVKSIRPGEPIDSLPPPLDRMAGGLAANLEHQDVVIDSAEASRAFGVTPTPADVVIRRALSGTM